MKTTLPIQIEIEVDFTPIKAERRTRHYPGCPASIEINDIKLPSEDSIIEEFEDEIMEACWEEVKEYEQERAISGMSFIRESINRVSRLKI